MLHVASPLPDEVETLIRRTIGCCITVHRSLGPGLLETIYSKASGRARRSGDFEARARVSRDLPGGC